MTDEIWEYIFRNGPWPADSTIPKEHVDTMKREFEYFYPFDILHFLDIDGVVRGWITEPEPFVEMGDGYQSIWPSFHVPHLQHRPRSRTKAEKAPMGAQATEHGWFHNPRGTIYRDSPDLLLIYSLCRFCSEHRQRQRK